MGDVNTVVIFPNNNVYHESIRINDGTFCRKEGLTSGPTHVMSPDIICDMIRL